MIYKITYFVGDSERTYQDDLQSHNVKKAKIYRLLRSGPQLGWNGMFGRQGGGGGHRAEDERT
jgi:hypothetical protein